MATVKRAYVDTPRGQIHYRVMGDGPVVLLLHQTARTGAIYVRLAALLAHRYRVLMPDLPGFGGSDPLPLPIEVGDVVDWVVALLDALGIRDVRVSGHHTGATVAIELAAAHPSRVVALAPTGLTYRTREERERIAAPPVGVPITQMGTHTVPIVRELSSDGSHLLKLFLRAVAMLWHSKLSLGATGTLMLPFENLPPEDQVFINDFVMDALVGIAAAPHMLAAVRRYDPDPRLPLITAPSLIIRSSGPLEGAYLQRAELVAELIPRARTAVIENGDVHFIHTRAEDLSKIMLGFFDEVDRAR